MIEHFHALPDGTRLQEYELVRVLGSGGFGITYLGFDHHLDKAVAVKEYLPSELAVREKEHAVRARSSVDKANFDWGLERFLDEARTLARFDHRNIVKVYRFFRAHGTGYIVMEYAEGETLAERLKRKRVLTEDELRGILLPILDGLEAVHRASFLHRDIKPSNIVIRADGSPVLLDFGSARQALGAKSRSVTTIVTPGYAPIEQYSTRGSQGPWTDIYALGAVCYAALTGEAPVDATDRTRRDPLVPATEAVKRAAAPGFLKAIDWALRVDEQERPQSVSTWRLALSSEPSAQSRPSKQGVESGRTASPARRRRVVASFAAGLILTLLATAAIWQANRFVPPPEYSAAELATAGGERETVAEIERLQQQVEAERAPAAQAELRRQDAEAER